jgi:hypothetical protein
LFVLDPWVYTVKRSTQTSKEKDMSDQWKVVLLETLGNAAMDSSFEFIMSHINTTNSAWIKRAGLHAMRKYEHDKVFIQNKVKNAEVNFTLG